MAILIDTSVLGRLANRADVAHPVAKAAIAELHRRGEMLHVTPQNLVEFRNFSTRAGAGQTSTGRVSSNYMDRIRLAPCRCSDLATRKGVLE